MLVTPGDPEELAAADPAAAGLAARAERLELAVARVQKRFAWSAVAGATVAEYRRAIAIAKQEAVAGADR